MKFIIIGPRSIGKTTVGTLLAKKLKIKYFDFDIFIEKQLKGINNHIEKKGVESYRLAEGEKVKEFISFLPESCIISIGGGTIASQFNNLNKQNIKYFKSAGKFIYLCPSKDKAEAIRILDSREKIRKGGKRLSETTKLFKTRFPIYEKNYDFKIVIKTKSVKLIVDDILKKLTNNN